MVDVPFSIYSHLVDEGVKQHFKERDQLCKYQPNIYHFDVCCGGKSSRDTDEKSREDKEGGEVDTDNSLKKEGLEEVCTVDNSENEVCRKIRSQKLVLHPPF